MSDSNSNTEALFRRLDRIPWQADTSHLRSNVALMREYLRRAALWAEELGCTEAWPFADFADYLAPAQSPPKEISERLENKLAAVSINLWMKKTCLWALKWASLDESVRRSRADLPDPFEPLLMFYERGGRFYQEHGYIYIEHVGIPAGIKGWQTFVRFEPVVSLDSETLDRLDG
jgi:hypothetical protein